MSNRNNSRWIVIDLDDAFVLTTGGKLSILIFRDDDQPSQHADLNELAAQRNTGKGPLCADDLSIYRDADRLGGLALETADLLAAPLNLPRRP